MIDYGHQSIADMVPVALFIDGISLWLAYHVWTLCPTAGGQESSTRYIRMVHESLLAPDELGIDPADAPAWNNLMTNATNAYQQSVLLWEAAARENPRLMGIPQNLLDDSSAAAQKKVARMRRNYAFDRARYFLPVAAATNSMLVMSARGWVSLCQHLLSHPLPEPRRLGEKIQAELQLAAPRLLKHARATEPHRKAIRDEFRAVVDRARAGEQPGDRPSIAQPGLATARLAVLLPEGVGERELAAALANHSNRYAPFGSALQRTAVRFGWDAMTFAEIRDLNRHRTGTKYSPQAPGGFYFAADQLPAEAESRRQQLAALGGVGGGASAQCLNLLRKGDFAHVYWSLLGTEYPFEHTTTADKFLYEAELRTGLGAHYRYAKHFRDMLAQWYERFPATRAGILEGGAEPE